MKRTTIRVEGELLERLRAVSRREGLSLAAVIRQGLEWRAAQAHPPLMFIAAAASSESSWDGARSAGEVAYEPSCWRSSNH